MIKIIITTIFLISFSSFASFDPIVEGVIVRGEKIQISKGCKKCNALSFYKSVTQKKLNKINKYVFGGRSWGDQICLKLFKQRIRTSRDKDQGESHYCLFKDQSYISTGELTALAFSLKE